MLKVYITCILLSVDPSYNSLDPISRTGMVAYSFIVSNLVGSCDQFLADEQGFPVGNGMFGLSPTVRRRVSIGRELAWESFGYAGVGGGG